MPGYPPYGGAGFGRGIYGYSRPPTRGGFRGGGRYVVLIFITLFYFIFRNNTHMLIVIMLGCY